MFDHWLNQTEETVYLDVPIFFYFGTIVTLGITSVIALFLVLGAPFAIVQCMTLLGSLYFWKKTTLKNYKYRRGLPLLVASALATILVASECWHFNFPEIFQVNSIWVRGLQFELKEFLAIYFFVPIIFVLYACYSVFLHGHLGNYLAIFIFTHGVVFSTFLIMTAGVSKSYIPGLFTSPILLLVSLFSLWMTARICERKI